MITAPVHDALRYVHERALTAAMQTDPLYGWPEHNGAYQELIQAEAYAGSLMMVSAVVPGILKDERYACAQMNSFDAAKRRDVIRHLPSGQRLEEAKKLTAYIEHIHVLRSARQRHIDARMADPHDNLKATLVMPDSVMLDVARFGREHAAPQAARLLLAVEQGWDIKLVSGATLAAVMGSMNSSFIATDIPGKPTPIVYREHDTQPHESVHDDPAALVEAHIVQGTLLSQQLSRSKMFDIFRRHAGQHAMPKRSRLFDLRGKR